MSRAKHNAKKRMVGADKTARKQPVGRPFLPGQSGNPRGRPKGARSRLGTQFLEALEADFNQFGSQAIALVREKKPEVYMRVVADLLPKEAGALRSGPVFPVGTLAGSPRGGMPMAYRLPQLIMVRRGCLRRGARSPRHIPEDVLWAVNGLIAPDCRTPRGLALPMAMRHRADGKHD